MVISIKKKDYVYRMRKIKRQKESLTRDITPKEKLMPVGNIMQKIIKLPKHTGWNEQACTNGIESQSENNHQREHEDPLEPAQIARCLAQDFSDE